jgi:archaemetzincin
MRSHEHPRHLAERNARPLHLCPVDLRKLQHSVGFDPEARYRRLLDFSRKVGFDEESAWLKKRLRHLEGISD